MSKEMTSGNPLKIILSFTLPMLVGNIFQQFYSMVDTIVVGKFIGVKALAAVGATGGITFFVLGFILGLANGFAIIVSHRFGSKDEKGLKKVVGNSIVLAGAFGVVVSILAVIFSRTILELLKTPADIIDNSHAYLVVIFAGLLASLAYNLIASILRALGDSKTPLVFLVVSSFINIVLDIAFVAGLKMNVEGTAYATIISQGISFILCFFYTKKHYPILHLSKSDFVPDWKLIKQLLGIGLPGALSSSITAFGVMIVQGTINQLGSDYVAAYTAGTKVDQFFTIPMMSIGMAMSTFAGQNLGAGKVDRILSGVKQIIFVVLGYAVVGGLILYNFGHIFLGIFINADSPHVIAAAIEYLRVIAFMCWALGFVFLFRSVVQGMGNGFVPMIAGFVELIVRVLVSVFLSKSLGFTGICWASPIAWVTCIAIIIPLFFRQLKIAKKQLGQA